LVGRFVDSEDSVILQGRIGMSRLIGVLGLVWLGAVAYIAMQLLSRGLYDWNGRFHPVGSPGHYVPVSLMLAILIWAYFGSVMFGRWWSKNDAAWIRAKVHTALDAQDT